MLRSCFILFTVLMLVAEPAGAQWRKALYTPHGASFRHVTAVTRIGEWYVCATDGAGIWRTRDIESQEWEQSTTNFGPETVFTVVATDTRAWAVTLYKLWVSDDSGATWNTIEPFTAAPLMALTVRGGDTLWVSDPTYGLFRTTDEGQSWTEHWTSAGLPTSEVNYVTVGPGVLGMLQPRWNFTGIGMIYSPDNGSTWVNRTDSLFPNRTIFMFFLENGYCRVHAQEGPLDIPYVYESRDGCETFTRSVNAFKERVAVLATRGTGLLFGTDQSGMFVSRDGGESFTPFNDGYTMEAVKFVGVVGDELFATNDQGDVFVRPADDLATVTSVAPTQPHATTAQPRSMMATIPVTRIDLQTSATVDVFDLFGRRIASHVLDDGTHLIPSPVPSVIVIR